MTNSPPRTLAEQLAAVLAYRNRPDPVVEPLQSNWSTVPANDNADPEEVADFGFERNLLVTPSVQEIMRQVRLGPVERNGDGQIVAIGRLQFSDGTQTEKAFTNGPNGDVIKYDRRMETGAMLRTVEKPHGQAGGRGYSDVDLENSNTYHASVFGTEQPRYIKRGKRRNGPSLTAEESRAFIDKAIANTPVMPAVKYYEPGLPCGAERVADSFLGFLKGGLGETGSIAWEDVSQTVENAKVWKTVRKALKSKDIAVLDAAMIAQTIEDLGDDGHKRTKERQGWRKLKAANDNLSDYLKKFTA